MNNKQEVDKFMKIHYIRGSNYKPIGCLVAKPISETFIAIGLSMCNTKHDTFNKKIGKELATSRAEKYQKEYKVMNHYIDYGITVLDELRCFIQSCGKYYKNKNIILPKIIFID